MKPNKPKHQKEGIGNNRHIAKVKASLDHAIHSGAIEEIEKRIGVYEGTS